MLNKDKLIEEYKFYRSYSDVARINLCTRERVRQVVGHLKEQFPLKRVRHSDTCLDCGRLFSDKLIHSAKGLCSNCYYKRQRIIKKRFNSNKPFKCRCGNILNIRTGLCEDCYKKIFHRYLKIEWIE